MPEIRVLYIDDEDYNLQAFKATFRRQYVVYTALSAKAAMDILNQTVIHVIISDQKMPEMTGVAFFKSIKNRYPDPARVLLTGYTDIETLTDAVNHGHIYRYITKPWNELEINNCIINAYDAYRAKVQLREKVEELEKTNNELNRFIYSISHELRAPLASALGIINLARLENLFDEGVNGSEHWATIEECCKKLDYNITNTLQYYKNSRYESIFREIDFRKLTDELIKLHAQANEMNGQITFNVNIDQPVKFYGDIFRIEIILGNLISNAIKYQKPDETDKWIHINIKATMIDAVITIADNGLGILSDHLSKIFTQFFRGKHRTGAGLGLFIVKEALENIKGTISVQSDLNKGTTFTIRFPNQGEIINQHP